MGSRPVFLHLFVYLEGRGRGPQGATVEPDIPPTQHLCSREGPASVGFQSGLVGSFSVPRPKRYRPILMLVVHRRTWTRIGCPQNGDVPNGAERLQPNFADSLGRNCLLPPGNISGKAGGLRPPPTFPGVLPKSKRPLRLQKLTNFLCDLLVTFGAALFYGYPTGRARGFGGWQCRGR